MKVAPVTELEMSFVTYLKQCQDGPVIVTEDGRPVAVLISIPEDDDLERLILAYTTPDIQIEQVAHIFSPRLAHPEQAADFKMEIVEKPC